MFRFWARQDVNLAPGKDAQDPTSRIIRNNLVTAGQTVGISCLARHFAGFCAIVLVRRDPLGGYDELGRIERWLLFRSARW